MQADLEESKTQENAKLRTALQEMQLEFQESKALLIKERESIKKEAEQVPTILEVPVIDNELVNKLTAENEMLKVKLFMHCYFLLNELSSWYRACQMTVYVLLLYDRI